MRRITARPLLRAPLNISARPRVRPGAAAVPSSRGKLRFTALPDGRALPLSVPYRGVLYSRVKYSSAALLVIKLVSFTAGSELVDRLVLVTVVCLSWSTG